MKKTIARLIYELNRLKLSSDPRPSIPYIINTLEEMLVCFKKDSIDKESLKRLSRGLGRLVTDDFEFSESPIGRELLDLISDVAQMTESS